MKSIGRLKLKLSKSFKTKLESVLDWTENRTLQQHEVRTHVEQEIFKVIEKELSKGKRAQQPDKEI